MDTSEVSTSEVGRLRNHTIMDKAVLAGCVLYVDKFEQKKTPPAKQKKCERFLILPPG